ncbi:enoyl-CoA hydratase/isomerase family protein [Cuniculiplasma sp. SKW4]|uniref:enoyl-CoA hydratase/isomerase family protein n=1 Tax=Cuniculiplasma sp. SKW4 TaxID=3400171 RepID=UPI003FD26E54
MALIEKEKDGKIGEIILSRIEKRNALNLSMIREMVNIFREFNDDPEVKLISVRSSGPDFSVGADINELRDMNREDAIDFRKNMKDLVLMIRNSGKIISFFLSGFSLGGGFEISQWADFRVASIDAKIGQPEIKIGVNAGAGGNSVFPMHIGYSNALYLSLTGRIIDAQRALELGIIQEVVDNHIGYKNIIRDISERDGRLLKGIKEAMRVSSQNDLMGSFEMEERIFIDIVPSDESKKSMDRFLNKR